MKRGEQKNPYQGFPERPWIRVRLATRDGTFLELPLLADTGNPCALIISDAHMDLVRISGSPSMSTNFGILRGGLVRLAMPAIGLSQKVLGYASEAVCKIAKSSHADFEGLAGLPLLRMVRYGGDADYFWIKKA